jgi:hypothetical protein
VFRKKPDLKTRWMTSRGYLPGPTARGLTPPKLQKSRICSSPLVVLSHLLTARWMGVWLWLRRTHEQGRTLVNFPAQPEPL